MPRRILRIAIAVALGLLLAAGSWLAAMFLGNPLVRETRGWTLGSSLPTARGETATAVAGGRLYVIGGLSGITGAPTAEVSTWDPASDTWTAAPPLPEARDHAAATALDGAVFVSGGGSPAGQPTDTLWMLPAGGDAWRPLPPLPEPRYAHRMVAVEDLLFVVGGIGPSGAVLVYDPVEEAWHAAAKLPDTRDHLAAVVVDGEIWAIGGRVDGRAVSRVDIYDPANDSWRDGPPLPAVTSGAAEAVTVEGRILLSGGEDPSVSDDVIDRHWQIDARDPTATWQPLDAPPLAVHGAQGAMVDGTFVIAGGASRPGGASRFSWSGLTQRHAGS